MRYHDITKDDMKNGSGLRVVLWAAGCAHHCKGCQNPITWDPDGGILFDSSAKQEIFEELSKDYVSGITFSGGDPLHPDNIRTVTSLAREIKHLFPDKNIWLYTGYSWEEIMDLEIIPYIDVLVDGEFILEKRDTSLHWKGSPNQRVINVQESLKNGYVSLHEE